MVIFNSYVSLREGIKREILGSDLLKMAIEIVDLQGITNRYRWHLHCARQDGILSECHFF